MKAVTKVGSIAVGAEAATITRRAFVGEEEVRTVRLDDVTGVDFRAASAFSPGHIRLLHPGNTNSSFKLREYDRDTIMFDLQDAPRMAPIRAMLMQRVTGEPFDEANEVHPRSSSATGAFQIVVALVVIASVLWVVTR